MCYVQIHNRNGMQKEPKNSGSQHLRRGGPVHEAFAIVWSGESLMYAALPPHTERLFPRFEHVTSRSQGSQHMTNSK